MEQNFKKYCIDSERVSLTAILKRKYVKVLSLEEASALHYF